MLRHLDAQAEVEATEIRDAALEVRSDDAITQPGALDPCPAAFDAPDRDTQLGEFRKHDPAATTHVHDGARRPQIEQRQDEARIRPVLHWIALVEEARVVHDLACSEERQPPDSFADYLASRRVCAICREPDRSTDSRWDHAPDEVPHVDRSLGAENWITCRSTGWVSLVRSPAMLEPLRRFWRESVPPGFRNRVNVQRAARREASWRRPRKLGDLRRTKPFTTWGADRGGSIPRYYIAKFMERHASDIHGRVLEIAGDRYTGQFGRNVTKIDILDILPDNPQATIVADFADAPNAPDETFDCLVVTQILSWIYDVRAPFKTAHRILAPGGVFLATTPGIARLAPIEAERFGEWWHFTSTAAKRVGEEVFGEGNVHVETFGNVLAAAASLFGLGQWDMTPEELDAHDPAFEVIVAVRAVKQA